MLTCLVVPCGAATGASADAGKSNTNIGIRLLELPANRLDDPRAQVYIVDHLAPGTVIKRRMLITNSSPVPRHIEVFPGAATIDNDSFNAMSGRTTNELTSWISFDQSNLDLSAGQSTEVLATIAVARNAAEGEQYGVIWAETSAPSDTPDNVLMISRVGIRVYLDVGAGGEPPMNFEVGTLTPARTKEGQPEVVAEVHNTGGRALDMAGELELSDGPGGVTAGPFSLAAGATVLPGHTARLHTLLDKQLPNGPWKTQLTLRSGSLERTVTATLTFPDAADTMGEPVTPEGWIKAHLVLLIGLAIALGVSLFAARRLLAHRRRQARVKADSDLV